MSVKYEFLKLTNLRTAKGLNKTQLSQSSDVSITVIRQAEKRVGHRQETLMKIYNALNHPDYYNGTLTPVDKYIRKKSSSSV